MEKHGGHPSTSSSESESYRAVLRVCVFSSVFETMEFTRADVCGPMGGD